MRMRRWLFYFIICRTHTAPHDGQNTWWNRTKMRICNKLDRRVLKPCPYCKQAVENPGTIVNHRHTPDMFEWV